jgi:hypothetical protein
VLLARVNTHRHEIPIAASAWQYGFELAADTWMKAEPQHRRQHSRNL